MADEPLIIVDAQGVEHEFPAGMDPKKAGAIIRAQTQGQPLADQNEGKGILDQPTNIPGVGPMTLRGMYQGALGGAKGFAKEIMPAVASAMNPINVAKGFVGLGMDAVKAISSLANPEKAYADTQAGLAKLPDATRKAVSEALDQAANDPESFGKIMADITGGAEVAMATARVLPMMPKPIALKVGQSLAKVGKTGEFAAYLTGAHQIASGDPKGLVTMAIPAAMRAASGPLIRMGTNMNEIPVAEQIGMRPQAKPQPALHAIESTLPPTEAPIGPAQTPPVRRVIPFNEQPLHQQMDQLPATPSPERAASGPPTIAPTRFNDLPLHQQMEQLPISGTSEPLPNPRRGPEPPIRSEPQETGIPYDAPVGAAQYLENLNKLPKAARQAEMAKRVEAHTQGKMAQQLLERTPKPDLMDEFQASQGPKDTIVQDTLEGPKTMRMNDQGSHVAVDDVLGELPRTVTPEAGPLRPDTERPGVDPRIAAIGPDVGASPEVEALGANRANGPVDLEGVRGKAVRALAGSNSEVPDFEFEGEANYDPSDPAPGPSAGGSTGSFETQLLASAGRAPEPNLGTGSIDLTGPNVVPDEALLSRTPQVPAAEVPASKSRRAMSATPGLTRSDVEGVGLNPDLPIKKLTPELVAQIKANRASRASGHRTNAGLNKGFERALMLDSE